MDSDIRRLLVALGRAITPGRGRETCELIREISARHGMEEDDFLPNYVVRAKHAGVEEVHGFRL